MEREINNELKYVEELLKIVRSDISNEELLEHLSDYHENDIAGAFERLEETERRRLYPILGAERISEIFAYIEDVEEYLGELELDTAAEVISHMDSDDAADVLEEVDDNTKEKLVSMMDNESCRDVKLIMSYDDDEIGSRMTNNYIVIHNNLNIRQAMRELVRQAGENDNISNIYVVDDNEHYYGAMDLKDLIIARDYTELDELISTSYPYVTDKELISDCIERIKDYAENSIPVLNREGNILGIITAQEIAQVVDDEMGDDYAKLAGLSAEEDLDETTPESIKKRLPWLVVLLFLGMGVSSVVGVFEAVAAVLPIVICFQSLILDMAGNVGTQSLAVTIRVLMDENLTGKQKLSLVWKEMRVGLCIGMILGTLAFVFIGVYVTVFKHTPVASAFLISGCVGIALIVSMVVSGMVGTLVPMFFKKIEIDPAVASGPLITTVNDLVAVVTYYGMAWILLINICHLG